jgi:hypothetical protein
MRQEFYNQLFGGVDGGFGLIDDDKSLPKVPKHSVPGPQYEQELRITPYGQREEEGPHQRHAHRRADIGNHVYDGRGIYQQSDDTARKPDAREIAPEFGALLLRQGALVKTERAILGFYRPHVPCGKPRVIWGSDSAAPRYNDP